MAAALKAVELNAGLAEPHASLGLVFSGEYKWDLAEREYRRAIDLAPGYASAHHWYHLHLLETGRFEEAGPEIARAEEADPLSPVILAVAGNYSAFRGRDEEAVRKWDQALELESGMSDWVLFIKTVFYAVRGRMEEAAASLRSFESFVARGGLPSETDRLWMPAALHAVMGKRDEAKRALDVLSKLAEDGKVTAAEVAGLCAAQGNIDQCYSWLFRAIESRSLGLYYLRTHPLYETVRADSRFYEVLRRCRVRA